MDNRFYLSILLLFVLALLSVFDNLSLTSTENYALQVSKKLDSDFKSYFAEPLPDKRILPAGGMLVNDERLFNGLKNDNRKNQSANAPCNQKTPVASYKNNKLIFGGATYLLIGSA